MPRIPPPPPTAPPPPPPSWAPPSRESELRALRQRQWVSSSSHPVVMHGGGGGGGGQQTVRSSVKREGNTRVAELDALRQKGLAKIFNRHFTTAAENIAREREAADLALAELERRKEEIKNNPNLNHDNKGSSGCADITMLDNMYMELQKRKSEVKRKEKETLELYRRYVNQYGESEVKPSPRRSSSQQHRELSNSNLPAVTEHDEDNVTVQRETDKLMLQMYEQASQSSKGSKHSRSSKDAHPATPSSIKNQIKKFDKNSTSQKPPVVPDNQYISSPPATTNAAKGIPSSSNEADAKASVQQTSQNNNTEQPIIGSPNASKIKFNMTPQSSTNNIANKPPLQSSPSSSTTQGRNAPTRDITLPASNNNNNNGNNEAELTVQDLYHYDSDGNESAVSGLTSVVSECAKTVQSEAEFRLAEFLRIETENIRNLMSGRGSPNSSIMDGTDASRLDKSSVVSEEMSHLSQAAQEAAEEADKMVKAMQQYTQASSHATPNTAATSNSGRKLAGGDPGTSWRAFYSEEHQREYFYEEHSNTTSWTMPGNVHEINDAPNKTEEEDQQDEHSVKVMDFTKKSTSSGASVASHRSNVTNRTNNNQNDEHSVEVKDFTRSGRKKQQSSNASVTSSSYYNDDDDEYSVPIKDYTKSSSASVSSYNTQNTGNYSNVNDVDTVKVADYTKKKLREPTISRDFVPDSTKKYGDDGSVVSIGSGGSSTRVQKYRKLQRRKRRRKIRLAIAGVAAAAASAGAAYYFYGGGATNGDVSSVDLKSATNTTITNDDILNTTDTKTKKKKKKKKKKKTPEQEETERLEKEKAEQERQERLKKEEEARIAREAAEKAEKERLAREVAEKAEKERLAKEAAEKAERERLAREAAEKAEKERLAREAAEKAEKERLAREAAEKAERERLAREKAERERLAREKAEKERLAREAAEKAERQRLAKEAAEKAERQRLAKEAAEKAERERLAREAAEKAERERLEREEQERLEAEAAAKKWPWRRKKGALEARAKKRQEEEGSSTALAVDHRPAACNVPFAYMVSPNCNKIAKKKPAFDVKKLTDFMMQ